MNETELKNRLLQADASLGSREQLAPNGDACRQIFARRVRKRRRVAGAAVLLTAIVGVTALFAARRNALPVADGPPPRAIKDDAGTDGRLSDAQVEALLREAEMYGQQAEEHRQTVALLRESARLSELEEELRELEQSMAGQLPPAVRVQVEVNRLATTQLAVARRLEADFGDVEMAADAYRRVADQFPDTDWALTAKEALVRLDRQM